jgi:hypothetical protein
VAAGPAAPRQTVTAAQQLPPQRPSALEIYVSYLVSFSVYTKWLCAAPQVSEAEKGLFLGEQLINNNTI